MSFRNCSVENVPKPDVLVFNTNQCREVQDWFGWYANEFNVPVVGISTPRTVGEVTNDHITFIAQQMERLIESLEKISNITFDIKN